jgi:4-carboxymuconolactone decarboxylase
MTIEDAKRRARGQKVLDGLGWGADWHNPDLDTRFWDFTLENNFGTLWCRPQLSLRDREMITLSVLIALGAGDGILPHFRNARNVGLTEEEVRELIFQVMYYAGWSRGSQATRQFNKVVREPGSRWQHESAKSAARRAKAKGKRSRKKG